MWVHEFQDLTSNPEVAQFFNNFRPYVQLRRIKWAELISGTPFENHSYFGNLPLVRLHPRFQWWCQQCCATVAHIYITIQLRKTLPRAGIGDLLRLLLGRRFGGAWVRWYSHMDMLDNHDNTQLDNDVVVLRDWRPLLINVGYQFVMRFINGHVR